MNYGEHIKQELIPLSSPHKWKKALQGIEHAFGHTWENCYAMHLTTGYETYLYLFEHGETKVVCPIAERSYNGYIDIVTPYGFSGFVGTNHFDGFQKIWKCFIQEKEYISGYFSLNPLFLKSSFIEQTDLFEYNYLYVLDLQLNLIELYNGFDRNRKRQIKKFEDEDQQIVTDKEVLKSFFLKNFETFFIGKGASEVYSFSQKTLSFLCLLDNVFMAGTGTGGNIEAVSVFAFTNDCAEALFHVSLPEGRHHTVPLLWEGIKYLKEKNIPLLNLGGGIKENDSVAQFKERFGTKKYRLKSLKQIYNQPIYESLCQRILADPFDKEGYFPNYRKSLII